MNKLSTIALMILLLVGCADGDDVWTLYRSSLVDSKLRIHVATFDEGSPPIRDHGITYNQGNCFLARDLFQAQPGIKTTFWCENGRFRK